MVAMSNIQFHMCNILRLYLNGMRVAVTAGGIVASLAGASLPP